MLVDMVHPIKAGNTIIPEQEITMRNAIKF